MRTLGMLLLAGLVLCIFPMPSAAQITLDQAGEAVLTFSPEYPRPGDTMVVKVQTSQAELESSAILWEVDGKTIEEGLGVDSITITAPKAGVRMAIQATIIFNNRTFVAKTSFIPASVTLLWQGVGITPPFYRGKTLLPFGGTFKVVALADFFSETGTRTTSENLVYTWYKNGKRVPTVSGVGKSSALFRQDSIIRGEEDIVVEVHDPKTNALARTSLAIEPVKNIISLYEVSPSLGRLYHKSLRDSFTLSKEELSLIVEPYFATASSRETASFIYRWKQDGLAISGPQANQITIRNTVPAGNRSVFSVTVSSESQLLQGGSASLPVTFSSIVNTASSDNLFNNEN